jgi:two-component system, sensor histidine kinase LadS
MIVCDNQFDRHPSPFPLRNRSLRPILRRVLFALPTIVAFSPVANADPEALPLSQAADLQATAEFTEYLLDPNHRLELDDVTSEANSALDFTAVGPGGLDVGYTQSAVWLRTAIVNDTHDTTDWVLRFHENFKQEFDVWVVFSDGRVEHPLALDLTSPFAARPLAVPQLAAPIVLPPGNSAQIIVRFWSEGSSLLPTSIVSADAFAAETARILARNFAFYGVITAIVVAAFCAGLLYRSRVTLIFGAYIGMALLFVMHSDGTAFQYLYGQFPMFNSNASVIWGGGFIFFAALYTQTFLRTKHEFRRLHFLLNSLMAVTIGMGLAMFVADRQFLKQAFVILSLVAIVSCLGASLVVARKHFREVRFYIFGWTAALASALLLNLIHVFGVNINPEVQTNTMRIAMAFDAFMMGFAILDRFSQMRTARQDALNASLAAAQRNLQLTRRMGDLERQLDVLDNASRQRDEAFANTIHDLRQPLHALRLRVLNEADGRLRDGAELEETNRGFDYLETLMSSYLNEVKSIAQVPTIEVTGALADVELGAVLSDIHEMFIPDAQAKGLAFRFVPTTQQVAAEPLVLMRMVSNFVSNAIRYTPDGGILLGCRRDGEFVRIEVHDTGPGLTPQQFTQARQRDVRLPTPDTAKAGMGYGLAIADDLAVAQGGSLELVTCMSKGLGIAIRLPRKTVTA